MYDEQILDTIIDVGIKDLFILSKEDCIIRLNNFSFKNKGHMAVMSIAKIARDIFGFKVEVEAKFFTYWIYNLKYGYKNYCKRAKVLGKGINVSKFIEEIENRNAFPNIFKEIYEKYYERH